MQFQEGFQNLNIHIVSMGKKIHEGNYITDKSFGPGKQRSAGIRQSCSYLSPRKSPIAVLFSPSSLYRNSATARGLHSRILVSTRYWTPWTGNANRSWKSTGNRDELHFTRMGPGLQLAGAQHKYKTKVMSGCLAEMPSRPARPFWGLMSKETGLDVRQKHDSYRKAEEK